MHHTAKPEALSRSAGSSYAPRQPADAFRHNHDTSQHCQLFDHRNMTLYLSLQPRHGNQCQSRLVTTHPSLWFPLKPSPSAFTSAFTVCLSSKHFVMDWHCLSVSMRPRCHALLSDAMPPFSSSSWVVLLGSLPSFLYCFHTFTPSLSATTPSITTNTSEGAQTCSIWCQHHTLPHHKHQWGSLHLGMHQHHQILLHPSHHRPQSTLQQHHQSTPVLWWALITTVQSQVGIGIISPLLLVVRTSWSQYSQGASLFVTRNMHANMHEFLNSFFYTINKTRLDSSHSIHRSLTSMSAVIKCPIYLFEHK